MTFGIDFDGTFAAAPELFSLFVYAAQQQGHTCVLVTQRTDEPAWADPVRKLVGKLMPIVFAGGMSKREAARRHGWEVDVWIDDNPAAVDAALIYVGR